MPNAFNFSSSPFDCLNIQEQKLVKDSVDIAYFKEGEIILDVGAAPTHLFILIKGYVRQIRACFSWADISPKQSQDLLWIEK